MPQFDFTSPDGKSYSVTGPDGSTPQQAFAILQQHLGAPAGPSFGSPDYVNSLAAKYGVNPGTVHGLVKGQMTDAAASGAPILGGLVNKIGPAMAAGLNPLIGGGAPGETFGERYAANKAMEDEISSDFSRAHPVASTVAPIAGGVAAFGGLTQGAGARILGLEARTLPGRMAVQAGSGAGIGGADALVRGTDPTTGAVVGGLLPPTLLGAGRVVGAVASPIISNIAARVNAPGYASSQVARALIESGLTPAEVDARLAIANREGQGIFTAADAMGNAGQRMLSTVARSPGEGRTAVVDALEARQAGQGRRISNQLAEGFDAPQTAAQTERRLTGARDTAADTEFDAGRNGAGPVDLSPAIARIDQTLNPGLTQIARPQSGLANDSIENALQGIRDRLTDGRSMLTDFTAVQRVRGDLADQVQSAVRAGQGNRARLLGGVLRQMDAAMEDASSGFLQANRNFSQASRNIEAVGQGRTAALRGRTEDTIPQFSALTPEGQAAYRAGYVDPLIADAQGQPFGVNKARPLINDAFNQESRAMAPRVGQAEMMQRQIAREQTMFETRQTALGGSKTADNLADQAAMGIDPSIIGHVISGNHMGALRSALGAVSNILNGNTPAVRQQVARILLSRADMPAGALQRAVDQTMQRIQTVRRATQTIGRGSALAVTDQSNRPN